MILLPLLRDDTAVASKFVDMREYDNVDFLILVGALDIEFDCKVQESVNADGSLPSDITSALITQVASTEDNTMYVISVKKETTTKRYVGLSADPGNGILGVNCAAVALRYNKTGMLPETQEVAGSNSYATDEVIRV